MQQAVRTDPRPAEAEPFSAADLRRLKDAVDRLLEFESGEWPTPERYAYIRQLERLQGEIVRRIPRQNLPPGKLDP